MLNAPVIVRSNRPTDVAACLDEVSGSATLGRRFSASRFESSAAVLKPGTSLKVQYGSLENAQPSSGAVRDGLSAGVILVSALSASGADPSATASIGNDDRPRCCPTTVLEQNVRRRLALDDLTQRFRAFDQC